MLEHPRATAISAAWVFVRVLCVVFTVEAAVMFVLPVIVPRSVPEQVRAIVDATMLTAIAAPLLWWVIITPILKEQSVRRETERELFRTQAKLQLAAEIQKKLLPETSPTIPRCDLAGNLKPAESTSGDFYDFISMPDGSIGIVIADVSGHGIDSALLVAAASAYLRALTSTLKDVGDILTHLNEFLFEKSEEGRFITMFLGRLDPVTLSFSYAAAGHRAYLYDRTTHVEPLKGEEPPLGVISGITVRSSSVGPLHSGQVLILVTDGIEESMAPGGELFGRSRVDELIQSHGQLSSRETVELLYREARSFSRGEPQKDDMTAIALKVL